MTQTDTQASLYERDFALWLEETAAKLRAGKFSELDIEALSEEIEALGRSEKRELKHRLDVLLAHILKRVYVASPYDCHGWENTIDEQRRQLESLLEQSPSLRCYFAEVFDDSWQYALSKVRKDYPKTQFPKRWSFSRDIDVILSETFWH